MFSRPLDKENATAVNRTIAGKKIIIVIIIIIVQLTKKKTKFLSHNFCGFHRYNYVNFTSVQIKDPQKFHETFQHYKIVHLENLDIIIRSYMHFILYNNYYYYAFEINAQFFYYFRSSCLSLWSEELSVLINSTAIMLPLCVCHFVCLL